MRPTSETCPKIDQNGGASRATLFPPSVNFFCGLPSEKECNQNKHTVPKMCVYQLNSTWKKLRIDFPARDPPLWPTLTITSHTVLLPVLRVRSSFKPQKLNHCVSRGAHQSSASSNPALHLRKIPSSSPACSGDRSDPCLALKSCPLALFFTLDIKGRKSLDLFEMNYTPVIAAAIGQY